MNRLTTFLTAIVAIALLAGPSLAGGIDQGSWEEFTGMTSGTTYPDDHLVGLNVAERNAEARGAKMGVTLNYETGEINYVTAGETRGGINEYYGVAPAWSETEGTLETTPKAYELTPAMERFL